jgi:L,D-transpeptidase catalytic domain
MKGNSRVKPVLSLVVGSLVLAPAAAAAAPTASGGALTARVASGLSYKARPYVVKGDLVTVTGTLKPYVAGQKVRVELYSHGKKISQNTVDVRSGGGYTANVRAKRDGALALWAIHDATADQAKATSDRVSLGSIVPSAHVGSHGKKVQLLQIGLRRLGYVTGHGASYGDATARSVIAFRKVNKMARITRASKKVFRMVFAGEGTFKLRYPNAGRGGKHVEFDWSRQVLALARGGRAVRIYHASSGKPSTPTVFGTFHFYRKQPGTNAEGMVDSNYFIRGYAIHGYASVPTYAASHGCIRVPIPVAASIYNWINLGDTIYVYR